METEELLARCPLFAGIAPAQRDELLGCLGAKRQQYPKGGTILAEGAPADRFGVVLWGAAQVVQPDPCGNLSITAQLLPGDLFAEAFACAGVAALPVSVVAAEDAGVLFLRAGRVTQGCQKACDAHARLMQNLLALTAQKSLALRQKLDVLSRRTTREKLLAYLSLEAKRAGSRSFAIPYDRQGLADYLGVDRSGLSVEIGKLCREGVLLCKRSRFTLL